ncbi:hypothetical protein BS78_01G232500 [Paspalum vaginatum]|nr:hypothetical protein BS78_01G232500 [Paspalum vaginatum]
MARTAGSSGDLLRSSSSIVAETSRGYHILKIDGYSLSKGTPTGDYLKSHPFTVGGHRWYIRYYHNGNTPQSAGFVSIFLHLDVETESIANSAKARYQLRFVDDVGEEPVRSEAVSSFARNEGWGYHELITRDDLEKSKHLKDDSFAIRCDILVLNEFRAK